ncbi:MAG TPA: hypothetical protein PKD85_00980 [Saprospiraceae bacterium]|nr:hypothetical protein [Saprospiraceae bacterium]
MTNLFCDIIDPSPYDSLKNIYNLLDLKCKRSLITLLLSLGPNFKIPKVIWNLILIYTARKSLYDPKRWDESSMLWMNNFWMKCPEQRKNNPLITYYLVEESKMNSFIYLMKQKPALCQVGEISKCFFNPLPLGNTFCPYTRRWQVPMYGDFLLGLYLKDISAIEYIEVTIYEENYRVAAKDLNVTYFKVYTLTEKGHRKMNTVGNYVDHTDDTDAINEVVPIYQLPPFLALPRHIFNLIFVDIKLNDTVNDLDKLFNDINALWTFVSASQADTDRRNDYINQHSVLKYFKDVLK